MGTEDELLAVIPADVTTGPQGQQLPAEEVEHIRRLRAREWAAAGFTSPAVVGAWIAAGVVSPQVAATAQRRGYRPGDPWVPQGFTMDPSWIPSPPEPPAGWSTAWRNRHRARRTWNRQQENTARGQARIQQAASSLRENVTAGSGSPGLLTAFDLAAATGTGPDPELVAGALDALAAQARALSELAEATADRHGIHTADETAHWLQAQLAVGVLPSGDTIPLEAADDPARWLGREVQSLADYARYLQDFITPISQHLECLTDAEQHHGQRELAAVGADLDTARRTWQELAGR